MLLNVKNLSEEDKDMIVNEISLVIQNIISIFFQLVLCVFYFLENNSLSITGLAYAMRCRYKDQHSHSMDRRQVLTGFIAFKKSVTYLWILPHF